MLCVPGSWSLLLYVFGGFVCVVKSVLGNSAVHDLLRGQADFGGGNIIPVKTVKTSHMSKTHMAEIAWTCILQNHSVLRYGRVLNSLWGPSPPG